MTVWTTIDGDVDEGVTDTFYTDADGDGFGDSANTVEACDAPDGTVPNGNDCDDTEAAVFPSNTEVCDGLDNDCNGEIDENIPSEWYLDADGDGYGDATQVTETCLPEDGYVAQSGDCNDDDATIFPSAEEVCDGVDNNCNGVSDEDLLTLFYVDADLDGYGDNITIEACEPTEGLSLVGGDCDDADSQSNPGADEICGDSIDNNCDGVSDEASAIDATTWYLDDDGDGYGLNTQSQVSLLPTHRLCCTKTAIVTMETTPSTLAHLNSVTVSSMTVIQRLYLRTKQMMMGMGMLNVPSMLPDGPETHRSSEEMTATIQTPTITNCSTGILTTMETVWASLVVSLLSAFLHPMDTYSSLETVTTATTPSTLAHLNSVTVSSMTVIQRLYLRTKQMMMGMGMLNAPSMLPDGPETHRSSEEMTATIQTPTITNCSIGILTTTAMDLEMPPLGLQSVSLHPMAMFWMGQIMMTMALHTPMPLKFVMDFSTTV